MLAIIRELAGSNPSEELMQRICAAIPSAWYTYNCGMGDAAVDRADILTKLESYFPAFQFRIILCHDQERTYFAITVKNPDPRELHEMEKLGYWDRDHVYRLRTP
jgi:hypothetical protein